MSINSSSSSNASLPPSNLYAFVSFFDETHKCFFSKVGTYSITALTITWILVLLPPCIFILYLAHKQWRQQRSGTTLSHSDLFSYHMVVTELLSVVGFALITCGVHTDLSQISMVGIYLNGTNLFVQMFFNVLTCVEHYLAVVHPITYLSLRDAKGIRLKNITICCVWLLCTVATVFLYMLSEIPNTITYFCLIAFVLTVVSFCSLSVLCVLIRPGPGEGDGNRQRVNQSKLRAFHTIMAILGVLLFQFGGNMFAIGLYASLQLGKSENCAILLSTYWFGLPSSLVLPLLFLQRAGKLPCCKSNR